MNKSTIHSIIFFIVIIIMIIACGKDESSLHEGLVGNWKVNEEYIVCQNAAGDTNIYTVETINGCLLLDYHLCISLNINIDKTTRIDSVFWSRTESQSGMITSFNETERTFLMVLDDLDIDLPFEMTSDTTMFYLNTRSNCRSEVHFVKN